MMYVKRIGLSSPEFKLVDYPTEDEPNSDVMLKSSDRMKQEKNESCQDFYIFYKIQNYE